MQVIKGWSDNDTVGAALFDDGYRLAFDEKSAVLISPDGLVTEQWWKEEPSGAHWQEWLERTVTTEEPTTEEIKEAIFNAGHYSRGYAQVAAAGQALVRLLV